MLNHNTFPWIPFLLHLFGSLFLFKNKNFSDLFFSLNHSFYFSNLLQLLSCIYALRNKCLASQENLIFKAPKRLLWLLYFWYNTIPRKLNLLSYFRLEIGAILTILCLKKQIRNLWLRWTHVYLDNWILENSAKMRLENWLSNFILLFLFVINNNKSSFLSNTGSISVGYLIKS